MPESPTLRLVRASEVAAGPLIPDDHVPPMWRCELSVDRGVFTIALDPREAEFVLERGWATLDGVRYRVTLEGFTGKRDRDGRVAVRCTLAVPGCLSHREALRQVAA